MSVHDYAVAAVAEAVEDAVGPALETADLEDADLYLEIPFPYAGAEVRVPFRSAWRLLASAGLTPAHQATARIQAAADESVFTLYHVSEILVETEVGTVTYPVADDAVVSVPAATDFGSGEMLIWRQTGDLDASLRYPSCTLGGLAV